MFKSRLHSKQIADLQDKVNRLSIELNETDIKFNNLVNLVEKMSCTITPMLHKLSKVKKAPIKKSASK